MTSDERRQVQNRVAPGAGGTSTPIAGSKDGLGDLDPVMSEEAGRTSEWEPEGSEDRGQRSGIRTDAPGDRRSS